MPATPLNEFAIRVQHKTGIFPSVNSLNGQLQKRRVRITHPRELYSIYQTLYLITKQLRTESPELKGAWHQVLQGLTGKKIYRIGLGTVRLECSPLEHFLDGKTTTITTTLIDQTNRKALKEAAKSVAASDKEVFGQGISRGFFHYLLRSPNARTFLAKDGQNRVVGILWGFFSEKEKGVKIFHVWELSRKANMPGQGVVKSLITAAEKAASQSDVHFITCNVMKDHSKAMELYRQFGFSVVGDQSKAKKIFMARQQAKLAVNGHLKPAQGTSLTRRFVLDSFPKLPLIYHALVMDVTVLWRKVYYR